MTNACIKEILLEKDITHLYHANTVGTACTFLENNGLLSRGYVEDNGLRQTPQESDAIDKSVDVYYDIFFDSVDIHERVKCLNHYGPVVFVYSVDLLDDLPEGSIRITKDNPIRWHPGMTEEEKYFMTEDALRTYYNKGTFEQHLTIRHQVQPLPFTHLEKIILDDPGIANTRYFDNALLHMAPLVQTHANGTLLQARQCEADCNCKTQYRAYKEGFIYYRYRF